MSQYYCPFCSSRYHFHKIRGDGVLICGHCGDTLLKKNLVNARQLFGMFAAFAFLAPLLIAIILVIKDLTKEKLPVNSESLVSLIVVK
tara:strand:- start:127 stop:390 length:264 start_codon:yes stop_codon:yes gene_type:complete